MLKPAQMKRIDLQIPGEYISQVTLIIANLKILHLLNVHKIPSGQIDLESNHENVLITKYNQLKARLENLSQSLSLEFFPPNHLDLEDFDPYKDILKVEKELQETETRINDLLNRIKVDGDQIHEKKELLRLMGMIYNLGIDLSQFHDCKFLYLAVGLIPKENVEKLEFSLSNFYHILLPSTNLGKRDLLFIFASKMDEEKIEKALQSAYFKKLELSIIKEGLDETKLQALRTEIQDIKIDTNLTEDYLKKIKECVKKTLNDLHQKVYLALLILDAVRYFDKVGNNYRISGWIPPEVIPVIEKEVKNVCKKQTLLSVTSPERNEKGDKTSFFRIPTFLKNPFFIKPFERLVFGYDVPNYNEIEPTLFFALSFLLMFGVMFGDVGHGIAIFLLGLLATRMMKNNLFAHEVGFIAMECGVFSMFFGFLYGSIFGFENILPALWFHPMENIYYFMKVTVGFGIVIISLGLLLNIINLINNKEFFKVIFGDFGMMGLLFYWGCVGIFIVYMIKGKFIVNNAYLFGLIFMPLLIIFFREPLYNAFKKVVQKKKVKILPAHPGLYFLESLIEIGDTFIGFLSNTVSFIRVSAFALAHAGLFLAVFALANALQTAKGGFVWYWLIVLFGNIAIILIEGLVVSIQTIRLEYYEFFSKFFKGGGELYQPF